MARTADFTRLVVTQLIWATTMIGHVTGDGPLRFVDGRRLNIVLERHGK